MFQKLGPLLQHVLLWPGSTAHRVWLIGASLLLWSIYSAGCLFYAYRGDPWSHGDWLISYSGGFIRRGLMGEAIFYLWGLSGIPTPWIVAAIQVLAAGVFFVGLALILFPKNITLGHLVVLLNPFSVGYVLVDPATAGRKEILFLGLAVIWRVLESRSPRLSLLKVVLGLSLTLVILSHEGLYFFIPLLLLISFSTRPMISLRDLAQRTLLLLAPSTLAMLVVALVEPSATAKQLCSPLIRAGYTTYTCDGAIYSAVQGNADGVISSLGWLASFPKSYFLYLVFLFGFLALAGLVARFTVPRQTRPQLWAQTALTAPAVLFTAPLFLVAVDWGRFVHVVVVIVSICIVSLPNRRTPSEGLSRSPKALQLLLTVVIASFFTLGVSVSDGQPRSILGNAINIGYFLQGGLTPDVFG